MSGVSARMSGGCYEETAVVKFRLIGLDSSWRREIKQERSADDEIARHASRTLDAEIIAAEMQNSTLFHTLLVFLGRIRDHRMPRSGSASACRSSSQDIDLSWYVPISTFLHSCTL